ncbi:protein ABHD11-like [Leptidea sinapis]|uniref:protein ABHD11-like n=1 Tax=Leptidea sinapis TaxID=189913 RepID=UPI002123B855|nr:protein ABHD11-like [Leptidea sinapis]
MLKNCFKLHNCYKLQSPIYVKFYSNNVETVDLAYKIHDSHYVDPSKPPLVTFHSVLGSGSLWDGLVKDVQKETGRRVINVDARCHGNSPRTESVTYIEMANDSMKLLRKLKILKSSVIGHSMGGFTVMGLSLLFPELVSSLIVVDVSPVKIRVPLPLIFSVMNCMSSVPLKSSMTMSEARKVADDSLKILIPNDNVRNDCTSTLYRTNTGEFAWKSHLPTLINKFESELAHFPRDLKGLQYFGPTLFICGASSQFVEKDDLPGIKEYFPQAEVIFIEGANHLVQFEKPKEFRETLCKFLNEK